MKNAFAALVFTICGVASALGSQDPAPPVNAETIKGVWDAIADNGSSTRVFRMELAENKGVLAVGVPFFEPMTFALTKTVWKDDGVELYFKGVGNSSHGAYGPDDPTPLTAVLRLHGVAWSAPEYGQSGGELTGEFTENPGRWQSVTKAEFVKLTRLPYLDTISKLSAEVKQAIEQLKQSQK